MAAQRITLCKFVVTEHFDTNKTIENLQTKNTAENYYIFSEQGAFFARGCYYLDQRYNIDAGEMEKVVFTRQYIVKFEINLQDQTLMLWGNKKIVGVSRATCKCINLSAICQQ
jgi:hypothetical protein